MEIFFIKLLQLILSLSLLVFLHEGGHFLFSRLFGVRVDKFYIFFDVGLRRSQFKLGPWTLPCIRFGSGIDEETGKPINANDRPLWDGSVWKWRPRGSKTTYGMGWLPFGGYCKIAGMIDESMDMQQMKKEPEADEFRVKPAWQRLFIMIGGVLVNFLLALFIYSMILFYWGDSYIPVQHMEQGMVFNSEARELGFQDGDILVSADGVAFKEFGGDLYRAISEAHDVVVLRQGTEHHINLPGNLNLLSMIKSDPSFVRPLLPAVVDSVMPASPAAQIGLQKGDRLVMLNDHEITSYNVFIDEIGRLSDMLAQAETQADSLRVRTVALAYARDNNKVDTVVTVLTPDLRLGFFNPTLTSLYKPVTVSYGFFESFPAGVRHGLSVLGGYVSDLKYVFSADGAKSLGGFGAIGSLFPEMWNWHRFWEMTAFLSIILAFMNILPIPILDGGYVLFLLYEIITRRKPSEKFMIYSLNAGLWLLVILMVMANLNDVLRWIGVM